MTDLAASRAMALSDRYFLIEPWIITGLFATSAVLAAYLVAFLTVVG
jgi:hypothetical protein